MLADVTGQLMIDGSDHYKMNLTIQNDRAGETVMRSPNIQTWMHPAIRFPQSTIGKKQVPQTLEQ